MTLHGKPTPSNPGSSARSRILFTAETLINGDRQKDYGPPSENFRRIADYWNNFIAHKQGKPLTPEDVALMMTLLKIARMVQGPKADSFIDAAAYCALAGELAGAQL